MPPHSGIGTTTPFETGHRSKGCVEFLHSSKGARHTMGWLLDSLNFFHLKGVRNFFG
ncbi:unnamed protein product [Ectocarpus sp. 8 AP-2014]